MLSILKLISICCLIIAVIFAIICIVSNVMLVNERTRWRKYKESNIVVEAFEIYDKGVLKSDKSDDIERIKQEHSKEYDEYKKHKALNNKLCLLFARSLIMFVILTFVTSFIFMISRLN